MKKLLFLILCFVLTSCFPFGFETMHVVGDFYIVSVDGVETEQNLGRKHTESSYDVVVERMVYAVWNNDSVIIVKQHPPIGDWEVDYNVTDFYIVVVDTVCAENGLYNDSVIGPLDSTMLKQSVKELGIREKIKFRDVKL